MPHNFAKYIKKKTQKMMIRLKNLNGTPYAIAAGFACGIAVSFTPFIGFHMILAALTAWLIRANIVASAIGTLIGNPWTFPFIWISVLYTGRFMLGLDAVTEKIDFTQIFESCFSSLLHLNFSSFTHDVWPVFYPMLIGCIPFYVATWLISYTMLKTGIEKIHTRKQTAKKDA